MAAGVRGRLPNGCGQRSAVAALLFCAALSVVAPRPLAAETMESALAKAYQNNPQLNAQRAIVRQADEGVPEALSGYRPTISANATLGREYSSVTQTIPPGAISPTSPGITFSDKGLTSPRSAGVTGTQTFFNGLQT